MGGQDLSFCVGLKAPFTNNNTSEEDDPLGLRLDLGNIPRNSSNEDRLQVSKEMIRTWKYLGEKSCYHRIKCITAAFLAALMWRRPLNSIFNPYHSQKIKKAVQRTETWVQGWMINKWTMGMNREDYIIEEKLHKWRIGKY